MTYTIWRRVCEAKHVPKKGEEAMNDKQRPYDKEILLLNMGQRGLREAIESMPPINTMGSRIYLEHR